MPTTKSRVLIPASFLFGLYVPTSFAGDYSVALWAGLLGLLAIAVTVLLLRRSGIGSALCIINSLLIVDVILASSIISPFYEYRWGGLLPYVLLALLYILNIKEISAGQRLCTALMVTNLVNIVMGVGVILHNAAVDNVLIKYYSTFYPGLVRSMTSVGKPVLSFGSHSSAAFFYYLFFLMNLEAFRVLRRTSNLIFAFCSILLGFALLSVTGIILMSVATIQIFFVLARRNWRRLAVTAVLTAVSCGAVVMHYKLELEPTTDLAFVAEQNALNSEVNGFSGRFSELGTLYSTVRYIRDRPFSPVGVGYRSDLFFGDSGPIEDYLRGSVFLLCSVYGGLFFFLKRNVLSKRYAILLFVAIMAFEIGFSVLTYFRLLCILPLLVIYFNDLSRYEMQQSHVEIPHMVTGGPIGV